MARRWLTLTALCVVALASCRLAPKVPVTSPVGSVPSVPTVADVVVVDSDGKPVAGATVLGVSLSIGGQQTQTDENGHAAIPWAVQRTQWITVSKTGYRPTKNIDMNQAKPIRVTLRKVE